MSLNVLCQGCLRARHFTPEQIEKTFTNELLCDACGSQWCHCIDCMETLQILQNGERGRIEGLLNEVQEWTAENGVKF